MARPGQAEAAQANQTYGTEQRDAFTGAEGDINQFRSNEANLAAGKQVAANPWKSADYLGNVNRLQAGALNSEADAGKTELAMNNRRTGGSNTGATIGATKDLALQKMRLGDTLSAERAAGDFGKNVVYQQDMARTPLLSAQAQAPFFSGAVSGQSSAIKNLTDLGIAQYGPWMAAIQSAKQAAAGAAGGGGG